MICLKGYDEAESVCMNEYVLSPSLFMFNLHIRSPNELTRIEGLMNNLRDVSRNVLKESTNVGTGGFGSGSSAQVINYPLLIFILWS